MKRVSAFLIPALCTTSAFAGPNSDGILAVHAFPQVHPTATDASLTFPERCEDLAAVAPADGSGTVWFLLAVFDGAREIKAVTLGLGDYDEAAVAFEDWRPADGKHLEIAGDGWPAPNTGTSVVWSECKVGSVIPLYRFVASANSPAVVPIVGHQTQGGNFANCDERWAIDPIGLYGEMGFGPMGANPCAHGGGIR